MNPCNDIQRVKASLSCQFETQFVKSTITMSLSKQEQRLWRVFCRPQTRLVILTSSPWSKLKTGVSPLGNGNCPTSLLKSGCPLRPPGGGGGRPDNRLPRP